MTIVRGIGHRAGVGWIQANQSVGGTMTTLWRHEAAPTSAATVTPYAEVKETNSAVVLLVGDRAFKLKKPVDLGQPWRTALRTARSRMLSDRA